MRKRTLAKRFCALTMVFTTAFAMAGCGANTKPASDQIKDITEAYKSGDTELFYGSMEESTKFDHYFDAVKNKTDSGLGAFYVKLHDKSQDVTVEPEDTDAFDIPVSVSTYDAYTVALDKMYEAAAEGPEAFADMPSWLSAALDDAEKTTQSVEFDSRKDTSSLKYTFSTNKDFFRQMTCGLYDFMDATMTTCTDGTDTTCLIAKGDDVMFSADYYYESLEDYGLAEDEVQEYIDLVLEEYNSCEGIKSEATYDGEGISQVIFIDYNTVSKQDLVDLGFLSSAATDVISLKMSIDGFEQEGMTCTTETFGITSSEESTEK